jgi:DNA-3-methyladenine glycosylase
LRFDPCQRRSLVNASRFDPCQRRSLVNASLFDPCQRRSLVNASLFDPCQHRSAINASLFAPCQRRSAINASLFAPCQRRSAINASLFAPCQRRSLVNASRFDPCQRRSAINASLFAPCQRRSAINASLFAPCQRRSLVNASLFCPCQRPSSRNASLFDLCQRRSLVNASRFDPCQRRSLVNASRFDLCQRPSRVNASLFDPCRRRWRTAALDGRARVCCHGAAVPARPSNAVYRRLSERFFSQSSEALARGLLGKTLVHGDRAGIIVETEAYLGPEDLASHARFSSAGRNRIMFGPGGVAYVYLCYGVHEMLNVVSGLPGQPGAVLLRALEPGPGLPLDAAVARGPGKLTCALGIGRVHNGIDLRCHESLFIAEGRRVRPADIAAGPRIGVAYAGAWAEAPLRFWIEGHPSVSRAASRTASRAESRPPRRPRTMDGEP